MNRDMDKIAIVTLGCKVNQAESETLAEVLHGRGYNVARDLDGASLCIVNTCTVTAEADHKSRKAAAKAARAGIPVIVTGCMVETDAHCLESLSGVKIVPNDDKISLPELVDDHGLRRQGQGEMPGLLRSRAVIKIQDGCDGGCSYCIVPAARGRSRSLAATDIESAVDRAVARGAAELVLTGVNLGDFGKDTGDSLCRLMRGLTARPDVGRIRLSSLEVEHLQDELLHEMSTNPKVCKHLHIPMQSGDDRTLEAMERKYRVVQVNDIVSRLRDAVPSLALTLDVMAGFPGETEEAFLNTLDAIEELSPAKLHVFPYSARPGTRAAGLRDQLPAEVKKERALRARKLGNDLQRRFVQAQVGSVAEVALLPARRGEILGVTDNYVRVLLESDGRPASAGLAAVNIVDARGCLACGTWA